MRWSDVCTAFPFGVCICAFQNERKRTRRQLEKDKEVAMREIYKESCQAEILLYLRNYGDTKRSAFVSLLTGYSERYIQKQMARAIEEGDIELYKRTPKGSKRPVMYARLTKKGEEKIAKYEKDNGEEGGLQDIPKIKQDERKESVLQVYSICKGMGMATEQADKPNIERLFGEQGAPETKKEQREIKELEQTGAFYSLTEIRLCLKERFGYGPLNATRCIGIVIRKRRLYFVYNMKNKLMYLNLTIEERARDVIMQNLMASQIANSMIDFSYSVACLLFGNNYTAIPKLFYERKSGEIKLDEAGNPITFKGKWKPSKDRLTLGNLIEVYPNIYFVSIKNARIDLDNATQVTPEFAERVIKGWLNKHENLRAEQTRSGAQAVVKGSGEDVFIWIDQNLSKLYQVFNSGEKVHVVIPISGIENSVARVLGTRLIDIRTMSDEILETRQYDDYGHIV